MKKQITIFSLVLAIILGSVSLSFAASSFTDITDQATSTAVEVLKLMGVVEGTGDGTYNPSGILSRAEFSKLAVVSMHTDADFNKYSNMTIFPDVKGSEWFAPYVNMAAKGLRIISGCPDGCFHPENKITAGEAVTLLLRLIGYTDEEIGGVWPYGHISFAKSSGMLNGISAQTASATITRADAAKLFVNAIKMDAQNKRSVFAFSGETVLKAVNQASKQLVTEGGTYPAVKLTNSASLIGKTGYVVTRTSDNKAVTFIPKTVLDNQGDVAVVIKTSGDASALTALAGRNDYTIYKNGTVITADKLKQNDIAIYRSDENKVLVCDTKLSVLYEGCTPSPASPSVVTALDGTDFEVVSSAQSSISNYKPGTHVSLYLTADGRIGAAGSYGYTGSQNNAVFIVDMNGNADLVCGNEVINLNKHVNNTSLLGKAARLNFVGGSVKEPSLSFVELASNSYGSLNIANKKLGSKTIAENALVFENGELTTLDALTITRVTYARENANGEIDLLVVCDPNGGKLVAGSAEVDTRQVSSAYFEPYDEYVLTLTNANGSKLQTTNYYTKGTTYVIANDNGKSFVNVKPLNYIQTVTKDAIISNSLVNISSGTLAIFKDVACFNSDTREWTSLSDALVYGTTFNLYGLDGTVYVMTYSYSK